MMNARFQTMKKRGPVLTGKEQALAENRHDNSGAGRFIEGGLRRSVHAAVNFERARKPITKAALT